MEIEVEEVDQEGFSAAAGVAARSLSHLFTHVGDDPVDRLKAAYDAYMGIPWGGHLTVAAFAGNYVVAMARATEPGHCWCDGLDDLPEPKDESERGVQAYRRFLEPHHPDEPHWWFGPVGVEPGLERRGLGSQVMRDALQRILGRGGGAVVLEAEPDIAPFYRRLGFEDATTGADPDGIELIFQRLIL